ncbi:Sphingosine kinase 1 [Trichinella pseudospiralis]|uniref:Sphingosine kinase 1 n=1 Tax=Trichinella pseudospiralis TaxID=6337 RepID=A0A0V0YHD3_TRIPS|nr:Sphingosine kinase 1 [Trichinella pseudospiralis]
MNYKIRLPCSELMHAKKKFNCTHNKDLVVDSPEMNETAERISHNVAVFVNPASGTGRAHSVFQRKVLPVIEKAGMTPEIFITGKDDETEKKCKYLNIAKYEKLLIVGGDGIIHEILNGLITRNDWDEALQLPIAVLPCGSGNALAASAFSLPTHKMKKKELFDAALNAAVNGDPCQLKLIHIYKANDFDIFLVGVVLQLKLFSKLCIQKRAEESCTICHREMMMMMMIITCRVKIFALYNFASTSISCISNSGRVDEQDIVSLHCEKCKFNPKSMAKWRCIDDEFLFVHASYLSHISENTLFMPVASLNDYSIYLTYMLGKDASKWNVFRFLWNLKTGDHLTFPFVKVIPVVAFCIQPADEGNVIMSVDGEEKKVDNHLYAHVSEIQAAIMI